MYWLSFADQRRPKGDQLLGVIVAPHNSFRAAVRWTHKHGINPGGECLGTPFNRPPWLTDDMVGKLLSREFVDQHMGGATTNRPDVDTEFVCHDHNTRDL